MKHPEESQLASPIDAICSTCRNVQWCAPKRQCLAARLDKSARFYEPSSAASGNGPERSAESTNCGQGGQDQSVSLAAPSDSTDDWRIDHSAGRPILVYKNCSVIEAEQAYYVLGLISASGRVAEVAEPSLPPLPDPDWWAEAEGAGKRGRRGIYRKQQALETNSNQSEFFGLFTAEQMDGHARAALASTQAVAPLPADERAKFEVLAARGPANLERLDSGPYISSTVSFAWRAWQARAALAAAPTAPSDAFDVEKMLVECVPGGTVCDPQQVADSIRAWFHRAKSVEQQTGAVDEGQK